MNIYKVNTPVVYQVPNLPYECKGARTMDYISDFLVWGIIAVVVAMGCNFVAAWLIDRTFESREK